MDGPSWPIKPGSIIIQFALDFDSVGLMTMGTMHYLLLWERAYYCMLLNAPRCFAQVFLGYSLPSSVVPPS